MFHIFLFRIFVDKNWHGEVNASSAGNRSGYQYYLTGLSSGQAYDINVRVRNILDIKLILHKLPLQPLFTCENR